MSIRILAHRGASAYAPENTMEAYKLAIEQGADGVELDVHLTRDGELAVIHDERVDRTTDGVGYIKDFTLAELKMLDASNGMDGFSGAKIPTLKEVYELFAGTGLTINVEIKTDIIDYPGVCEKLLALEDDMGMNGSIIYSSFNHYTVKELLKLRPDAKTGLLYMSILDSPWDYALRLGAKCLHPHFITISKTPGMAAKCREMGIETNIWTVDEERWLKAIAGMGVTSVITNKPDYARAVLSGI